MAITFGNVNKMTLSQFNKSIEYFENRIKILEEDETITPNTMSWYVKNYQKRIKKLKKTSQKLEILIASAREKGVFVNESSASFESLDSQIKKDTSMSKIKPNVKKHRRAQFFRILGSILLPVVGTIPLIKSYKIARANFKEIKNSLDSENLELSKFINNEKRPYDAKLTTTASLTNEEIHSILKNKGELARIEKVLYEDESLTPAEKNNISEKLANIKQYAQEHGYSFEEELENEHLYETENDKTELKIQNVISKVNSFKFAGNFKQLYHQYQDLKNLNEKIEALLETNEKHSELLEAFNNTSMVLTSIKPEFQNYINGLSSKCIEELNILDVETSKVKDIDDIYKSVVKDFGAPLEDVIKMVDDLELDASKVDELFSIYTSKKDEITSRTKSEEEEISYNQLIENAKNTLTSFNDKVTSLVEAPTYIRNLYNVLVPAAETAKSTLDNYSITLTKKEDIEFIDSLIKQYTTNKKILEGKYNYLDFDENEFNEHKKVLKEFKSLEIPLEEEQINKAELSIAYLKSANAIEYINKKGPDFATTISDLQKSAESKINSNKTYNEILDKINNANESTNFNKIEEAIKKLDDGLQVELTDKLTTKKTELNKEENDNIINIIKKQINEFDKIKKKKKLTKKDIADLTDIKIVLEGYKPKVDENKIKLPSDILDLDTQIELIKNRIELSTKGKDEPEKD